MIHRAWALAGVGLLAVLLFTSLIIMNAAMESSARFGQFHLLLLGLNGIGLITFIVLIGINLCRLLQQWHRRVPGSRLTLRMVLIFSALAVIPVSIVYGFSLHYLKRGIDTWFDVRVEQALKDSLALGREALDARMRELVRQSQDMAHNIENLEPATVRLTLSDLRGRSGASELVLLTERGDILAADTAAAELIPHLPNETTLAQARQRDTHFEFDELPNAGPHARVLVKLRPTDTMQMDRPERILQALFPLPERINRAAVNVEAAFTKYQELTYLRRQLKNAFAMSLTLVLLFSVFTAVWAAIFFARLLAAPVRDLLIGTQAVAQGNYHTQLPVPGNDEVGALVQSFNEMTRRLTYSRDEARQNRDEVEAQRAYLEAVLANLSSGVMTLDTRRRLRTANVSAKNILGLQADAPRIGEALSEICRARPFLEPFRHAVEPHLQRGAEGDWQEQVILSTGGGRRTLMCRGTSLAGAAPGQAGHVIVFDDITALIQGQRDAAWSEVARRLAHEIKNPLTPIQLSAERLRLKYLKTLPEKDAEMLDRLTHTIVQQVETMKEMVNTFSDYARAPQMKPQSVSINQLVEEVLDLYRSATVAPVISLQLAPDLPPVQADTSRLRQVLNNLIKNALEASENGQAAQLAVSTHVVHDKKHDAIELRIADRGRGIAPDQIDRIFEPYVTHKTKGTGLGLAIAKKIVEEHGGTIWLENNTTGGASSVIRLPLAARNRDTSSLAEPAGALRA